MAGLGWTMRQKYSDEQVQNQAKQMPTHRRSGSQIACRICHQIFNSTKTLITHIESHMIQKNLSSSSSNQRNITLNPSPSASAKSQSTTTKATAGAVLNHHQRPVQPNFYFPTRFHNNYGQLQNEFYNIPPGRPTAGYLSPVESPVAITTNFSFGPTRTQCFPGQPPAKAGDCTMPLLHQLEKRNLDTFFPHHKRSFSDSVDLTLKL